MDTFNQNIEYQNALNFLQTGCDCGCSNQLPHEKFAQFRSDFQNLPKIAQDTSLMTQLTFMSGGTKTTSPRLKNKERTNQRFFYR